MSLRKLTLLSVLFFKSLAFAEPVIITAPTDHLFVPKGFDSNDSTQVVVTGNFPTPCYSLHTSKVVIKGTQIDVTVTAIQQKNKKSNAAMCATLVSPFKEEVSIGMLAEGKYTITVNKGSSFEVNSVLNVESTQSSLIDDYMYLDVMYLEQKEEGSNLFRLKGLIYSPCIELDRVETISNGVDTISVLPIMRKTSDFCPMKMVPVDYDTDKIDLSAVSSKTVLLHVRTMNGKSVNTLVTK